METNNFDRIFKKIIREGNITNTYKMAWAKALVEIACERTESKEFTTIELKEMAEKILKYYWNQTIFFDLIQGSNLKEIPLILQHVKELIKQYYNVKGERKPERFERIEEYLKEEMAPEYEQCIMKVVRTLKKDVSWRFTILKEENINTIYQYNEGDDKLEIPTAHLKILQENCEDLFDLINYRWGMILETFNTSPRINKKVRIIDEQEVKRNSLLKFRKYLDVENPTRKCFLCGKDIEDGELSIDHVIPWSYLYSDDLWNLVYVHKSCNSSKSNIIPSKYDIAKIENRNREMLQKLKRKDKQGKIVDELELAIEKNYIRKFWIGCKS